MSTLAAALRRNGTMLLVLLRLAAVSSRHLKMFRFLAANRLMCHALRSRPVSRPQQPAGPFRWRAGGNLLFNETDSLSFQFAATPRTRFRDRFLRTQRSLGRSPLYKPRAA